MYVQFEIWLQSSDNSHKHIFWLFDVAQDGKNASINNV